MQTLRQEAIDMILKMPESVKIDGIMYRLYVIDKIRKGREAVAGWGDENPLNLG